MRRSNLTGIVVALLTMGWGGQNADAAERRCEFRFDHEKPAWVAELEPGVRQRLADMIGQIMVLRRADADPVIRREFACGCYMDHVDWDAVLEEYPDWYRSEPIATGKLAAEYRRTRDTLRTEKTAYRRKHCL